MLSVSLMGWGINLRMLIMRLIKIGGSLVTLLNSNSMTFVHRSRSIFYVDMSCIGIVHVIDLNWCALDRP